MAGAPPRCMSWRRRFSLVRGGGPDRSEGEEITQEGKKEITEMTFTIKVRKAFARFKKEMNINFGTGYAAQPVVSIEP